MKRERTGRTWRAARAVGQTSWTRRTRRRAKAPASSPVRTTARSGARSARRSAAPWTCWRRCSTPTAHSACRKLCTRLDLPRQSAHRILNQLLELRLLQRHITREQYTIGPRLRTLTLKAAYQSQRTGPWHSVLEALAERTGETCNLGILDQNKVLLIDRIEFEYALRVHSEVGRRLDPHASAIGKLLLAHLSKGRRLRMLEQAQPLKRFTAHTLVDIDELETEFATIRRQGYSVSNQGTTLGMLSLAAPVRDVQGRVVAGIACQAPFVRMSFERAKEEIVPALIESGRAMDGILAADEADQHGL